MNDEQKTSPQEHIGRQLAAVKAGEVGTDDLIKFGGDWCEIDFIDEDFGGPHFYRLRFGLLSGKSMMVELSETLTVLRKVESDA